MASTNGWDRESSWSMSHRPATDRPSHPGRAQAEAAGIAARAPSPATSDRPRSALILIVDKDPAVRRMLGLAITRLGALPIGAANGLQAFRIAHRRIPDAIVTDLAVPGLDGAGLIRRLRDTPWGRHVPVIVFSAQLREPGAAEALDLPGVQAVSRAAGPGPVLAQLASLLEMRNPRWRTGR